MDLMVIQRAIPPGQLVAIQIQLTLLEKIREAQSGDLKLQEFREEVRHADPCRWNAIYS